MTTPKSGQISISDISSEFGGSQPHSMSEYYNKAGGPSSGQLKISDFYYKRRPIDGTITELPVTGLNYPYNSSFNEDTGDLYVADTRNNRIVKLDSSNNQSIFCATSGYANTVFYYNNYIYFSDNNTGACKSDLSGNHTNQDSAFTNGVRQITALNDKMFFADYYNNRVTVCDINLSNGNLSNFQELHNFGSQVGGVTIGSDGYGYCSLFYGHKIYKFSLDGSEIIHIAGFGTGSSNDGIGTNATFNRPARLAFSPDNKIYVSEFSANKIRAIDMNTYEVTTLISGLNGVNGMQFYNDRLYITEMYANRVRAIT
jgi:DNA-binding beta-propeller fold protein YncE